MKDILSPPLESLNQCLIREMGLSFPPERLPQLWERLGDLFSSENGTHAGEWWREEPWPQARTRRVARLLTVGETYFLRDAQVFTGMRTDLLPALIARGRNRGRRLSIWSAGCASGEEIYSIAILLRNLLPDLPAWNLTLRGTDINPDAIERARSAQYGEWSFRAAPAGFREEHFVPAPQGRWTLMPEYRSMVHFEEGNLVHAGPLDAAGAPWDLILCRNVLMYFQAEQAVHVLRRLAGLLRPDGILLVGLSELHLAGEAGLRMRKQAGTYCFESRRDEPGEAGVVAVERAPSAGSEASPHATTARTGRITPAQGARVTATKPVDSPAARVKELLVKAVDCASSGRHAMARQWLEEAIGLDPVNPDVHLELGVILEEQGEWEEARESLKRALFLNEQSALASFHLGLLALREEDGRGARHYLTRAQELARQPSGVASNIPGGPNPADLEHMIRTALGSTNA